MVTLGIDWGEKRIGVAYSRGNIAGPLKVIEVATMPVVDEVKDICNRLGVDKIVLGVPWGEKGKDTEQSRKVCEFGEQLENSIEAEVVYWNETLSSQQALQKMIAAKKGRKARRELDAASAAIILQDYLDSRNKG
ncbi:MAG: Holliday junction resolvase RuvX [Patescibacteria group bacterium]